MCPQQATIPATDPKPAHGSRAEQTAASNVRRLLDLSLPVRVVLADRDMPIESILEFRVGSIIEFEVPFDSELTLYLANKPIGHGQAVKVSERFGLRITRINTVNQRIRAMGDDTP